MGISLDLIGGTGGTNSGSGTSTNQQHATIGTIIGNNPNISGQGSVLVDNNQNQQTPGNTGNTEVSGEFYVGNTVGNTIGDSNTIFTPGEASGLINIAPSGSIFGLGGQTQGDTVDTVGMSPGKDDLISNVNKQLIKYNYNDKESDYYREWKININDSTKYTKFTISTSVVGNDDTLSDYKECFLFGPHGIPMKTIFGGDGNVTGYVWGLEEY